MEKISAYSEERWLLSNSTQNEHQEDDMLSLCDLPQNHLAEKQEFFYQTTEEEDFNFFRSKSEMCCADEVFFQGQILPLRHSVSSEKGLTLQYGEPKPSISRSESMDHRLYSSGLVSTSRSSSISQSSSSGSSTKTLKLPQSYFFAHPSPSPRVHNYSRRCPINSRNNDKANKSSVWRIFRTGLIATPQPEIAIQDLKTRTSLGSRKSNASSSTNSKSGNKQKKGYFLGGGGCKCAVDDVVPSRVVLPKQQEEEGKSKLSHRRTFEWLKQLSLEVEATR